MARQKRHFPRESWISGHSFIVQHNEVWALYRHSLRDARTAGLGETTRHDTVPQTLVFGRVTNIRQNYRR